MKRAGIWIRVSTVGQEAENQVPDIEQFCAHHGYEIAQRYVVSESAWNGGPDGGDYRRTLKGALADAWAGKFDTFVVWSLDRVTREGAEGTLRILREFRERGCVVVSVKEDWLTGSPQVQDVLVAFAGWMAQQESKRRSERVRAGIERRKRAGTWKGRGPDQGRRRKTGYLARWKREREASRG